MSPILLLIGFGLVLGVALAVASGRLPAPSGRAIGGAALVAAAVGLAAARQFALAAPVGLVGVGLLRAAMAAARAAPTPGQSSEVRTDVLAMRLDHDSGEMDGEVLAGRFSGAWLSSLSMDELRSLAAELEDDHDSLGLLLAYIERRRGAEEPAGTAAPPPGEGGEMSAAEALRVLGLGPGASLEEIRAAHRRLMKRVHPDLGGSDALAAMINAAKARLDP